MKKKLLILDLDETLVHAAEVRLETACDSFPIDEYTVYKRPFLDDFLDFCKKHFMVSVWTSASSDYAAEVVSRVFGADYPLEFVFARERCVRKTSIGDGAVTWIKDLKKVRKKGYPLEEVIIVDDTPAKLRRNYGNHVYIKPFEGNNSDSELLHLHYYLYRLKEADNIRSVEKRYWRTSRTQPDRLHMQVLDLLPELLRLSNRAFECSVTDASRLYRSLTDDLGELTMEFDDAARGVAARCSDVENYLPILIKAAAAVQKAMESTFLDDLLVHIARQRFHVFVELLSIHSICTSDERFHIYQLLLHSGHGFDEKVCSKLRAAFHESDDEQEILIAELLAGEIG